MLVELCKVFDNINILNYSIKTPICDSGLYKVYT